MEKQFISYCRVSTARQGVSGLGLEAQQAQVAAYVQGRGRITREYVEVESGKKDQRPKLSEALAYAKANGATLLIAKLDRLSRNAAFIFTLRDAGVDFICCDVPDMNTLTIGIFAVIAQHERETISTRTKSALQAKKARGFALGSPRNLTDEARAKGRAARSEQARQHLPAQQARQVAVLLREKGQTVRQIAATLNSSGYATPKGGAFHPTSVLRLLTTLATA